MKFIKILKRRKKMLDIAQYEKVKNCYTSEVDGYGYAFVPGSAQGVVLLDLRTKKLLDNLSIFKVKTDTQRIDLLIENRLLKLKNKPTCLPVFDKHRIKSMSIWLHIANCCNLDCSYCYIVGKDKQMMSRQVANDFLDKLERTVEEHKLESIAIRFAGGEPTLNKKILDYISRQIHERFAPKGIGVKRALLTNGTVFDEELLGIIKQNKINVCVSLDGLDEWHDKTRSFKNGQGSFATVFKNIEQYLKNDVKPTILTVITEQNVQGIPDLTKFLISTSLLFRYGLYRDNIGGHKAHEAFMEKVLSVMNDCHRHHVDTLRNHKEVQGYQFCEIHLNGRPHLRSCNIGYSGVTVDHLGRVFLCQSKMDEEPIGNIKDKDTLLSMAWSQKTFPELNERDASSYENCRECQWLLICSGGCSVTSAGMNGSVVTASPYCKLFKAVIPNLLEARALQLIENVQ